MQLKKYLENLIESPVKLFTIFIIVNMFPSLGLIFTEPYDIWGRVVLILFPLGIYFVLYSILKNIGLAQLLLLPLLIIHAFQIVVFYLFGEGVIAVDMFLNVVTTNVSEAGEVLQGVLASVIFVIIVYVPTIILAILAYRKNVLLKKQFRLKTVFSGIALIIGSYFLCSIAKNENTGQFVIHKDVYPVDVAYNLKFAVQKWSKSRRYPETSKDFIFDAYKKDTASQREIYVLVVGETSRAGNWGLYGYDRNTTPHLQKDSNIVVIKDAITQSNTTHKSVSIMLSTASAENYDIIYEQKSMLAAFKEAGFTSIFLSNQSANNTFTDYFAREADYVKYFRFFSEKTNNYDDVLLSELQHCIDSIDGNLFAVLHTYGSHFNYRERYPEEYSIFKPDDVSKISRTNRDMFVNAYDNTILYTDNFLYNVSKILYESDGCSAFFYTSDHGEDILDDDRQRFLHASPNPTFYQLRIPMLLWFSPNYKRNYPQIVKSAVANKSKPVTTNIIFHTLLDMAHIETKFKDSELSFVNKDFKITERMYLDDHDKPIPFYNAGLKKEDYIQIKENNIAH